MLSKWNCQNLMSNILKNKMFLFPLEELKNLEANKI